MVAMLLVHLPRRRTATHDFYFFKAEIVWPWPSGNAGSIAHIPTFAIQETFDGDERRLKR
jgi:hypothetical protein